MRGDERGGTGGGRRRAGEWMGERRRGEEEEGGEKGGGGEERDRGWRGKSESRMCCWYLITCLKPPATSSNEASSQPQAISRHMGSSCHTPNCTCKSHVIT